MKKDSGLVYGFGAYILWGILPLYWKLLGGVSSIDILFYRIIWSLIFMLLYMIALRKMPTFIQEVKVLLKNRKKVLAVIMAAIFVSLNWGIFIYTVSIGQVQQASLGYYINPLLNVLAGALYLKEPLTKQAKLASLSALTGVILLTLQTGVFPFNSLFLAASFCLYGSNKKTVAVEFCNKHHLGNIDYCANRSNLFVFHFTDWIHELFNEYEFIVNGGRCGNGNSFATFCNCCEEAILYNARFSPVCESDHHASDGNLPIP